MKDNCSDLCEPRTCRDVYFEDIPMTNPPQPNQVDPCRTMGFSRGYDRGEAESEGFGKFAEHDGWVTLRKKSRKKVITSNALLARG